MIKKDPRSKEVYSMKCRISLFILSLAVILSVSSPAFSQTGNFARYNGWSTLTEREKLCFVMGYGYGTGNRTLSLTPPVNFVRQIDDFFITDDFQIFSVDELFEASNWLFLGFPEQKINTYLRLQGKCIRRERITPEELSQMETIKQEAEQLENDILKKISGNIN